MEIWLETKQMKLTKETLKRIIEEELKAAINELGDASLPGVSIEDGLRKFLSDVEKGYAISPQECEMRKKAALRIDNEELKQKVMKACAIIQAKDKKGHRGNEQ